MSSVREHQNNLCDKNMYDEITIHSVIFDEVRTVSLRALIMLKLGRVR